MIPCPVRGLGSRTRRFTESLRLSEDTVRLRDFSGLRDAGITGILRRRTCRDTARQNSIVRETLGLPRLRLLGVLVGVYLQILLIGIFWDMPFSCRSRLYAGPPLFSSFARRRRTRGGVFLWLFARRRGERKTGPSFLLGPRRGRVRKRGIPPTRRLRRLARSRPGSASFLRWLILLRLAFLSTLLLLDRSSFQPLHHLVVTGPRLCVPVFADIARPGLGTGHAAPTLHVCLPRAVLSRRTDVRTAGTVPRTTATNLSFLTRRRHLEWLAHEKSKTQKQSKFQGNREIDKGQKLPSWSRRPGELVSEPTGRNSNRIVV